MKTCCLCQRGRVLVPRVLMAMRLGERMRGLLGRGMLPVGTGMLLSPCSAVHTVGMQFSIDVIYLDATWRPLRLVRGLKPWRMSTGGFRACHTLELQSGWFAVASLALGAPVMLEDRK